MTNYLYFDNNGQKHGPVRDQQLKELATRRIITTNMPLETDDGHKWMKNTFIPIVLLLLCSLVFFFGCSEIKKIVTTSGGKKDTPETSVTPNTVSKPKNSEKTGPIPKNAAVDEKKLCELIKAALWKEYFTELPYAVSEVTVEWGEKEELTYTGNYTAVIKAQEKMYESISNREGRKELLGGEDEYEGKLKIANDKAKTLPEPHKSQMLNCYPTDDLRRFDFYKLVQPKGGEQKIRGKVELTREHPNDPFKVTSLTKRTTIESAIPDSELDGKANRLDDEETHEKLKKIVDQRKAWIARVDETIQDVIDIGDTEWKKGKEEIRKFIYPGAKYEGVSKDHEMGPTPHKIVVEFGDYGMTDHSLIYGRYYNPDAKGVVTTFQLPLPVKQGDSLQLVGLKQEHFNPQGLKGVPNYYSWVDLYGTVRKVHIGFHENNLLFRLGNPDWADYFRGELTPVASDKKSVESKESITEKKADHKK